MRPTLRGRGRRGNAIIELTLMAPWLFFLFVGVLDFGYYTYALISVQNAARVAALTTSASSTTTGNTQMACDAAINEMNSMPNSTTFDPACGALSTTNSLHVTATAITAGNAPDAGASSCGGSGCAGATQVAVTYQTILMIPIPGILTNNYTFTRVVEMRARD